MTKRYHVERRIAAPPERVWSLLTDAAGYGRWNPTVLSIDGDMAEGSKVRLVTTVNPKRTFELDVTTVDAPDLMIWSDGMPLGLFSGVRTFRLTPVGTGSTDFSMTEEFSGPMAPLITRMIPDMTDSFAQFADGLQAAAEEQPGP